MNYRCFKKGCELEAQYFRKCLLSKIYCCEFHLKVQSNFPNIANAFDSIYTEPFQQTKDAILGFLKKKKLKREKLKKNILSSGSLNENIEEVIRNIDSDLEEIAKWIKTISQTQKISNNQQELILSLLTLQPENALKRLRAMIPSSSEQHSSIKQLYWLNKLSAKTYDILNNLNISETEQDFLTTCSLYENEKFSNPLLKQAYQEYIKAYHHTKSIYMVFKDNASQYNLIIYDTEKEKEDTIVLKFPLICSPIPIQLPNYGLLFSFSTSSQSKFFIIDRNYGLREIQSRYKCSPLIYFNRSIYCYAFRSGSRFLLKFDLDENRWIFLTIITDMPNIGNGLMINRNILIAGWPNILLYSIDINSFSLIPYQIPYQDDQSDYEEDSPAPSQIFMIEAEKKLYFIVNYHYRYTLIYESDVENQFTWKQTTILLLNNFIPIHCLFNNGIIYFSSFEHNNSRHYYKFDINLKDFIEESYYFDYIALKETGKKLEAIKYYNPSFKFDPHCVAAKIKKGLNLAWLGGILDRIEYNTQIISQHASFEVYYDKGELLMEIDMYNEAIECFNKALKLQPLKDPLGFFFKSWCFKGTALRNIGKWFEAIKCYEQAYSILSMPEAMLYKGNTLLYDLGRDLEAIKCYDEVITSHPNFAEAYYHKGNALVYNLNWNLEAIKCYNKAIFHQENYINAYNNKGYVLNMLGKHLEAIKCYQNAFESGTQDAIIFNNKGDALNALGRNHVAIECYNAAIDLKPDDFLLYINRGRVLNELENETKALKDFNTSYNLMKETVQESYHSDLTKQKLYEWNSSFINDKINKDIIKLLKNLIQLQEYIIIFKEEYQSLINATIDNQELKSKIEKQKQAIKTKSSQFIMRLIEFLGYDNRELYEEAMQKIYKLKKEVAGNKKLVIANIADLKSYLKRKDNSN